MLQYFYTQNWVSGLYLGNGGCTNGGFTALLVGVADSTQRTFTNLDDTVHMMSITSHNVVCSSIMTRMKTKQEQYALRFLFRKQT